MRCLLFHDRVTQGAKMPGAGRKKTAPGEGMVQLLRGHSDALHGVLACHIAVVHGHGVADALQTNGVLGGKAVALHVACHIQAGDDIAVGIEGVTVLIAFQTADAHQQQRGGELVGVEGAVLQRPHTGCRLVEVLIVAVFTRDLFHLVSPFFCSFFFVCAGFLSLSSGGIKYNEPKEKQKIFASAIKNVYNSGVLCYTGAIHRRKENPSP